MTSMSTINENGLSLNDNFQVLSAHVETQKESQFFQDMGKRLTRLRQFVQSLGNEKDVPINDEVLEKFQRSPEEFEGVDSNFIIREAIKRIQKMQKIGKTKKNWSVKDMKILIWVICKYSSQQSININEIQSYDGFWKFVSDVIPGTTPQSCLFKWLSQKRCKISLHNWKSWQQKQLKDLQKKYTFAQNKWKAISQELYLRNKDQKKVFRHAKQCREHFSSFLDPHIVKGPWSNVEDNILMTLILLKGGEKKWCKLAQFLEGRTQNAIKNRYQLLFCKLKKKKQNKNKSENELIRDFLKKNTPDFEVKKQGETLLSILQQKSDLIEFKLKAFEQKKNCQSLWESTSSELISPELKILPTIVLNRASDFKPYSEIEELIEQKKNSFQILREPRDREPNDKANDL